jgi:oligopeptide/dipeptide ABC transporter ATP-binding protein
MTDVGLLDAPSREPAKASAGGARPVASVRDLQVSFQRPDGSRFAVVEGVSFDVLPGEVVGIVGESGSGKSMTARSIMGLIPPGGRLAGRVMVGDKDVLEMSERELRALRGMKVSMVFQDPMTSFNPVLQIGEQIGEAVSIHRRESRGSVMDHVVRLLSQVGILQPAERAHAYPHEFSGGMRQRALIAMSIANNPALVIADEPTTALDVTVQDQVLDLMRELNTRHGTAIILITHNIAVVASICQRLIVMYAGRIVEDGPVDEVLGNPQHPYTWMLLQSVPRIDKDVDRLMAIEGSPPDPSALPAGCKFHTRCPFRVARCSREEPMLEAVRSDHRARCWVLMDKVEGPDNAHA